MKGITDEAAPQPPASVDAVVVGGGHAGIEAAWALARLGHSVALVTFDAGALGRMSCNPSIGGLAKGQLVREIDALGGLMGRLIDRAGIHFRTLNRRKGPAVQAPRAQADKESYSREALRALANLGNLVILEAEVTDIQVETAPGANSSGRDAPVEGASDAGTKAARTRVVAVLLAPPDWSRVKPGGPHSTGPVMRPADARPQAGSVLPTVLRIPGRTELSAKVVLLTVGTFLRGKLFTGMDPRPGGRRGEPPAEGVCASLEKLGVKLSRLKTGTPPRIRRGSIDFRRLRPQPGDEPPPRFSYFEDAEVRNRVVCHLTRTNESTHRIIASSMDRSPLYGGLIKGIGPRYCPSIEDKVKRFPDRKSHPIFLEPEGLDSDEIYPNGISTSLPLDVQESYIRTIPGLEGAEIVHPGYAVEYDFMLTSQIDSTLSVRGIEGLFAAGQINGTSGYEEAAAQGIVAGMNAHALLAGREPIVLPRSRAYIGVLIDDLVTKVPTEPYRMFTSQSEYRLLLRQDNADRRLSLLGREIGLLGRVDWERVQARWAQVEDEHKRLKAARLKRTALERWNRVAGEWSSRDIRKGTSRSGAQRVTISVSDEQAPKGPDPESGGPQTGASNRGAVPHGVGLREADLGKTFEELLRRPEVRMRTLRELGHITRLSESDEATIEAEIKYAGYIQKQEREIARTRALEDHVIPATIFDDPPIELSGEARERLHEHRPRTLGQALRIPGITPNDVFMLAIRIRSRRGKQVCSAKRGKA